MPSSSSAADTGDPSDGPAANDRLAGWHFWIANIGVVGLIGALIPYLLGVTAAEPFTAGFSFVVLAGMILFAIIVFRATAKDN